MTQALFIPGLLCTGELYAPQIETLSGLDVMIGDHQSYDSISEIARHILEYAPEKFVLAGLSMGGYVALEVMRQAGDQVQALILLDTSARADAPEKAADREKLMTVAANKGIAPVVDALLPHIIAERHHGRDDLKMIVSRMARDTGPTVFARQQTAIMNRQDSRPSLAAINCPTLIVVGDEDTLTPPELAQEIAEGIPGAHLEVVPECGHLATIEQPEAVNAAIKSFLKGARVTA